MAQKPNEWNVKVVGHRRGADSSPAAAARWLKTMQQLRGTTAVCPRGLYRFKTFEEADRWMMQMRVQSFLATRHRKT